MFYLLFQRLHHRTWKAALSSILATFSRLSKCFHFVRLAQWVRVSNRVCPRRFHLIPCLEMLLVSFVSVWAPFPLLQHDFYWFSLCHRSEIFIVRFVRPSNVKYSLGTLVYEFLYFITWCFDSLESHTYCAVYSTSEWISPSIIAKSISQYQSRFNSLRLNTNPEQKQT